MHRSTPGVAMLPFLLSGCVCILGVGDCADDAACSDASRDLVAGASATAVAYPDELPAFVDANAGALAGDAFETCITAASEQMIAEALRAPSRSETFEQAADLAHEADIHDLDLVNDLTDDLYESSLELHAIGTGLQALRGVLVDLRAGDLPAYHASDTYRGSTQLWQLMAAVAAAEGFPSSFVPSLREWAYGLQTWYLGQLLVAVR